jgi:mono/diheme cytochrome c family protein
MNSGFAAVSRCSFAAVAVLALAACSPSGVSYSKDVQPILTKNCAECHAPGKEGLVASGLDVTSYQALMKGGKFGPLVKPGDALSSSLNMLVEGRAHPSIRMPHGKEKLADKDIETLKVWVNEGAKNN